MLVKDETKYCWCEDEVAGEPQNSIKDAIQDYLEYQKDLFGVYDSDHGYFGECDVEVVRVGHPYCYVPEVDGERAIWNVLDYNLDDEIAEYSDDYMKDVKNEHMDCVFWSLLNLTYLSISPFGFLRQGSHLIDDPSH